MIATCTQSNKGYEYPYRNPDLRIHERVSDLLSIRRLWKRSGKEEIEQVTA